MHQFSEHEAMTGSQIALQSIENFHSARLEPRSYIKRLQRRLARQQKGSNRRAKTKYLIAVHHAKKANIRHDFAHKTSRSLVNSER